MTHISDDMIAELKENARKIRASIIRSIYHAGSGHPGGSLSATDIITALYFHEMKHDPENPSDPDRDRLVLSKGHAAPALYGALAYSGYFPVEELDNLRKLGHFLQGHPDMRKTPGVDISTGSLGQGLSIAVGMALAGRIDRRDYNIYTIHGDGEIQSGQIWEAAMSASHFKLNKIISFLDRNHLQIDGRTDDVMTIEPIFSKFKAFGWYVQTVNGHDFKEILHAIEKAKKNDSKPSIIIANTIKGKGVSFMEGSLAFHGKSPDKEQYEKAMEELGGEA